jgi:hypothetical protein
LIRWPRTRGSETRPFCSSPPFCPPGAGIRANPVHKCPCGCADPTGGPSFSVRAGPAKSISVGTGRITQKIVANETLYQLSYTPSGFAAVMLTARPRISRSRRLMRERSAKRRRNGKLRVGRCLCRRGRRRSNRQGYDAREHSIYLASQACKSGPRFWRPLHTPG